jgi:hypothetical protein
MSLSVRTVFVNALMNLGHAHLEQAQSSISRGLKIATVTLVNHQREGALKALDYYILASVFASEPHRMQIASDLCKNHRLDEIRKAGINLENFRQGVAKLAFEYFEQQNWEHAAPQFLLCLKCFSPEELAKSPEGAKITVFLAKALGALFTEGKIQQSHLDILDQAIDHHLKFTEQTIKPCIKLLGDTWVFLVDQGCCLYYLRGCIRESLPARYTKGEVLKDFQSATAIALKHPWGAYGYFAVDDQASPQDNKDLLSYRNSILEWGAGTLHSDRAF